MKLFEVTLNEMICPICGCHRCKCDSEQEEVVYKGKKITIGKHDDTTDSHYNPHELAMGVEEEKEHTNDDRTAKNIAKDHLSEIPDYYSRLKKMTHTKESLGSPQGFSSWVNKRG